MDLSIVIPAYNEATKIRRDVESAAAFLVKEGLKGEIIVVDDGSADGTWDEAVAAQVPPEVEKRVIHLEPRRGKGRAVRTGMTAARGRFAMFADTGMCIPFDNALRGIELIRSGQCEVAHGSRKLPESVIERPQGLYRRLVSRLFRGLAHLFMGVPWEMTDTQCGFKIYRGDVGRQLYGECISDGFTFDVETLLRARRHGYRVREFPVQWRCDWDSRLRPARGSAKMLSELIAIKKAIGKERDATK
jgi:dolichyl-phosphate beta-glucosyltransferase